MTGKILLDEVDKSPYFLSITESRRYYPVNLGFDGSAEDFIKCCEENPPDVRNSYTEVSRTWKPSFYIRYMNSEKFRKLVNEQCRQENLKCRFDKDAA